MTGRHVPVDESWAIQNVRPQNDKSTSSVPGSRREHMGVAGIGAVRFRQLLGRPPSAATRHRPALKPEM